MANRTSAVSIGIPPYVRLDGDRLIFTELGHAQAFVGSLQLSINEAIESGGFQPTPLDQLHALTVDDDGWIDRESLYEFFGQRYTSQQLHNRVTNLVRIMHDVAYPYYRSGKAMFEMRCTKCNNPLTGLCNDGSYHRAISGHFAVKASSIIADAEDFREDYVRGQGPKTMEDFELLVGALTKQ